MPTNDDLLRAAIGAFQAGQLDNAEQQFRALLKQDPKHLAGLNLLGMVLTAAQKFDEAERTIKAALAINANSDATHYNLGIVLNALKRPDEALASFDRAIAINPNVADSWSNRGVALNALHRYDAAISAFGRASALQPNHFGALYNTGNALAALGRHDEAIGFYDKALQVNELSAEAWNGRGASCNALRRLDDALAAFNRAAGLNPNLVEAWLGLGSILSLAKDSDKALVAYDKALALNPVLPAAWLGRALSLAQMQRKDEAIAAYRDAAAHGVDAGQVKMHLAALGAEPPPAATAPESVIAAFDHYAETFDSSLVGDLKYGIPAKIAEALKRHAGEGTFDILDLGCGTGLAGAEIASLKRSMTGVDLSTKMLEKARARGVYDHLVCAELIEFLGTQKDAAFDIAVSADVFIYIGDLTPVFAQVRRTLRKGGLFCFSLEASPDSDIAFRDTFHYAHSVAYVRRLADENGLVVAELEPVVVRHDRGTAIDGYLVVLRAG